MKKILFIVFLVCINFQFFAGLKNHEKSVTPWINSEIKSSKNFSLSHRAKQPGIPVDTCPIYQVYEKKIVTASSRGEINNTGWYLKDEFKSCDPVDMKEKRVSYDVTYIRQGDPDEEMISTEIYAVIGRKDCDTCGWPVCVASKNTHEVKVTFPGISQVLNKTKDVVKTFPRVNDVKVSFNPIMKVKVGEDCCSKFKPPVSYMELKGGVEASFEIEFILWGFGGIHTDVKCWPFLILVDIQPPAFTLTPFGKLTIEGVGKQYSKPECKTCFYLSGKLEAGAKIAIKAGGKIELCRWDSSIPGYSARPDGTVEASAEASLTISSTGQVTSATKDCTKPQPGIHGQAAIDGAKANLKFKISLGIISFNYDYELILWDGLGPFAF